MKKAQLIALERIKGVSSEEDLQRLNGIFKSQIELFDDNKSQNDIAEELIDTYKTEICKFFNPDIQIKFID